MTFNKEKHEYMVNVSKGVRKSRRLIVNNAQYHQKQAYIEF